MLALFCALVGLLALFLGGSLVLMGMARDSAGVPLGHVAVMSLLGLAYLLLAWGLWKLNRWVKPYSIVVLVLLVIALVMDTGTDAVMELSDVLVFFLAALVNMAVVAWLRMPSTRKLLD